MDQIEHGSEVDSNGNEALPFNVYNSWIVGKPHLTP
jgi:hypothetical protein